MFIKFLCTPPCSSSPRTFYGLVRSPNSRQLCHLGQGGHGGHGGYGAHRSRRGLRLTLLQWLSGVRSRYCMWKLQRLLAPDFDEFEFLVGARYAATSIVEAVRQADWSRIHACCTDQGACAIYNLCQSQKNILYSKLLRFESQHLCQVSPKSVRMHYENGRSHVYVNLAFVALRNMRDFATLGEQQEMQQLSRQVLEQSQIPELNLAIQQQIVLSEFAVTLRRDLKSPDWLVDFYKVFGFKLVNYSPITLEYRIVEILKPV